MEAELMGAGDSIGTRVLAARTRLGWSRALLAEYAGTSPKTIEAIERGVIESPGSILLARIAAALGVTCNDLIPPQEIAELPRPGERLDIGIRPVRRSGGRTIAVGSARTTIGGGATAARLTVNHQSATLVAIPEAA